MNIPTYQNPVPNKSGVVIPFAPRRITGVQHIAGSAPARPGTPEVLRINSQMEALNLLNSVQVGVRDRVANAFHKMAIQHQLSSGSKTLQNVPTNPYAN